MRDGTPTPGQLLRMMDAARPQPTPEPAPENLEWVRGVRATGRREDGVVEFDESFAAGEPVEVVLLPEEGYADEEPPCKNCDVRIREGDGGHAVNDPLFYETYWVHLGGYRWCNPQIPGQTTHAEPISYADRVNAPLTETEIDAINAALKSGDYPRFRKAFFPPEGSRT